MSAMRLICRRQLSRLVARHSKASLGTKNFHSATANRCDSSENTANSDLYDVVISGGGMVGGAMAASLAIDPMMEDKKILVLEGGPQKAFSGPPEQYQSRTCALSPGTIKLLSEFGAWENICSQRYQQVKRMQVWDSCSNSTITFNKEDLTENLAYIVENDIILGSIMTQLEDMSAVDIRYDTRVVGYQLPHPGGGEEQNEFAGIKLDGGEIINTRLLIGADGARSLLRKSANIKTIEWDYNQFALCATLNISETLDNNVAWQRFLTTGPIAMLPLSPSHSCLIWSTSPENAKNLLKLDEESFVDAVNDAFWAEDSKDQVATYAGKIFDDILSNVGLGSTTSRQLPPTVVGITEGSRAMFPLGLCHSTQYVKKRMALIGDAAHRCHPLAGQGVNLGFGDVTSLRDQIVSAVSDGIDIGSLDPLLKYETERQRAVIPTLMTTDGLKRLYGTSWTPIVLARSLGLQATNALGPIKNKLMSEAMN